MKHTVNCPYCRGTGEQSATLDCFDCGGTGKIHFRCRKPLSECTCPSDPADLMEDDEDEDNEGKRKRPRW